MSSISIASADEIDVWIGTGQAGIYHLKLDTEKGKMSQPELAAGVKRPGFLAMHPNGRVLYSTDGADEGSVTALTIGVASDISGKLSDLESELQKIYETFSPGHKKVKDLKARIQALKESESQPESQPNDPAIATNQLTPINSLSTGDGGAACVAIDKTAKVLMSAQYGGGSVSTYLLKPDGSLDRRVEVVEHGVGSGVSGNRQDTAHPHWVGTSPDNRFLMVPDLGMDRIVVYELDSDTAKLTPHAQIAVPPGSGPRHMKFHPSGNFVYVLNELSLSVSVFAYDAKSGEFEEVQVIETLPDDLKDKHLNSAAEIRVHPSGQFIYTSNRGHDSITVFSVDQQSGKLTFVERVHIRGSIPRNFNVDPSGKWLIAAGQDSNTLALFEIDQTTGALVFTRSVVNVPAPICVLFASE